MTFNASPTLRSAICATLAASTFTALPAIGQQGPSESPRAGASSASALEEIVVTARRREENLQSVPVAITAFSGERLEEKNITQSYDLQYHTPGLSMRAGAGTRTNVDFFIRGQGPTFGSAPAVVTYFAEAPLATPLGGTGQYFDLESIQVLKGPQGTLFGRSTTGGAVLISPARPTDRLDASIQGSFGNYSLRELTGFLNVPLVGDKLTLRIAANSVRRDGFTKSITTGQDLDDQHRDSVRVGLSFKPTEWFENYLMFQDNRANESNTGAVTLAVNPALPFWNSTAPTPQRLADIFAGRAAPSTGGEIIAALCTGIGFRSGNPAGIPACIQQRTTILNNTFNGLKRDEARLAGENSDETRRSSTGIVQAFQGRSQDIVNITRVAAGEVPYLGDLSFKNIFATTRNYGVRQTRDLAGGQYGAGFVWTSADISAYRPVYNNDTAKGRIGWLDRYSDEFQIAGVVNGRHNWLLGIFYENDQSDLIYPPVFSSFGEVFSSTATLTPGLVGGFTSDSKTLTKGYFGQFTVDLGDLVSGLKFTGGYRWSSTDRRSVTLAALLDANGNLISGAASPPTVLNDQAPSWNVSFDYRVSDNLLVYLAQRRGFKPGGVNVGFNPAVAGATKTYSPETLDDLELGAKLDWSYGEIAGRTNGAIYAQRYNDIQRAQFLATPTGSVVQQTNNIAKAEIFGLELENLARLTPNLEATLVYAYISPRYTEWPGTAANGIPLVKSPYPGAAKHQGTIGLRYSLPLATAGSLVGLAEYYRQSSVELNDSALQDGFRIPKEPGYGNVNLRLDWRDIAGLPVDAGLFVRNATDVVRKLSVNSLYSSAGFISALYAEPRTYGLELRYRFEGKR